MVKRIKAFLIYLLTYLPNIRAYHPLTKEMIDWHNEHRNYD